ncbi:15216_t:CDS:2 [Acaulospora colombiana]|uniref:15216_t:CDS:1 n=1 Tax=Acaulospora colombiana TaxID=27376 RepID=A0ACA9LF60_9GLOM|nr:15216_t:CDS:2 [Acaulospora colombiana]
MSDSRTNLLSPSSKGSPRNPEHTYYTLPPDPFSTEEEESVKSIHFHDPLNDEGHNAFLEINENLVIIRDVIKNLAPLGSIKNPEELITDAIVDYVFEKCKKNQNVVFVTLHYVRGLQEVDKVHDGHGGGGPAVRSMRKRRIECGEILARELVHKFEDQDQMFTEVLTRRYAFSQYDVIAERRNALELAVRLHSNPGDHGSVFLADDEALWIGDLMPRVSAHPKISAPIEFYIPRHRTSFLENFLKFELLNVPRNQYLLNVVAWITLLIVYTLVAADCEGMHEYCDFLERTMYILVLGFLVKDICVLAKYGIKIYTHTRKVISLLLYVIFIVDFTLRAKSVYDPKSTETSESHRKALSLVPLFLHWRVMLTLDAFQTVGRWLTEISRILRKSMSYFILMALASLAFFQSFLVLNGKSDKVPESKSEWSIMSLLVKGMLNAPDFQASLRLGDRFGFFLYSFYVFTVSVILFAFLLPLFMTSFITRRTVPEEYLAHFATIVVHDAGNSVPGQYNYPPPFNLLYYAVIMPVCFLINTRRNSNPFLWIKFEKTLIASIFFIPMIVFAIVETRANRKKDKDTRGEDIRDMPDLPVPGNEKQMLRKISTAIEDIQELQKNMHARLEIMETQLKVFGSL